MEKLQDVMRSLIKHYTTLLTMSKSKTALIKDNNVEELTKLLMKEQALVQQISKHEEKRHQLVETLFKALQINGEEKTISLLLQHLTSESEKNALQKISNELIEIIKDVQQIENMNAALLNQSLALVQLSLDMLQPSLGKMNYTGDQRKNQTQKPSYSVFDAKA